MSVLALCNFGKEIYRFNAIITRKHRHEFHFFSNVKTGDISVSEREEDALTEELICLFARENKWPIQRCQNIRDELSVELYGVAG